MDLLWEISCQPLPAVLLSPAPENLCNSVCVYKWIIMFMHNMHTNSLFPLPAHRKVWRTWIGAEKTAKESCRVKKLISWSSIAASFSNCLLFSLMLWTCLRAAAKTEYDCEVEVVDLIPLLAQQQSKSNHVPFFKKWHHVVFHHNCCRRYRHLKTRGHASGQVGGTRIPGGWTVYKTLLN